MNHELLATGLKALGPNFEADICDGCNGVGKTLQNYTVGCGMGSYESMGPCPWCKGCGLLQGSKPVPASVLNQVLNAARAAAALGRNQDGDG